MRTLKANSGRIEQRLKSRFKRINLVYFLALILVAVLLSSGWVFAQVLIPHDPGVRGGLVNLGGGLQQRGILIPHPPLLSLRRQHISFANPQVELNVSISSLHQQERSQDRQLFSYVI